MLVHISRHEASNGSASVALGKIQTQIRVCDGPLRTVISTSHTAAESFVHKTRCLDGDQISWDLLPAWAVTARRAVSWSFKSARVDLEIYLSSLKIVLGVLVHLMWCLQFFCVHVDLILCACGLTEVPEGSVCALLKRVEACVCRLWDLLWTCSALFSVERWFFHSDDRSLNIVNPRSGWAVVFDWRVWGVWY